MNDIKKVPKLHNSWSLHLLGEFEKEYMKNLKKFLLTEKSNGKVIFPKGSEYFNAFNYTSFDNVKAVIIGQDPYHGEGQAHGLCFSVKKGVSLPPSLVNIFKELKNDLNIFNNGDGCLEKWAKSGVLLLNSVLTVEKNKPASHKGKGWEIFTDKVISILNEKRKNIVFILWGSYAHEKGKFIDGSKHLVLKSPHPSPFSAYQGFFGCRHFSKTNEYLIKNGIQPVEWNLNF